MLINVTNKNTMLIKGITLSPILGSSITILFCLIFVMQVKD